MTVTAPAPLARRVRFAGLALFGALVLAGCGAGVETDAPAGTARTGAVPPTVDLEALAHNLVTRNAAVREGDVVLITGHPRDLELLENLAVWVRAVGAFPLVTIFTPRLQRRMYDDVPERYDSQPDAWQRFGAEFVDVVINVSDIGEPGNLAHVPPSRMAARSEAGAEARAIYARRQVRIVNISNDLYPHPWRAEQFGMSVDELARLFWEGVAEDPDRLAAIGERLKDILSRGTRVHVTHPNGTDLSIRIANQPVFVSAGVVPDQASALPNTLRFAWLPAGEVYLAPVPGSVEGRLVLDRHFFQGTEIRDLVLDFADGRLVAMDAGSDMTAFRTYYDGAAAGKELVTAVDLGFNPGISAANVHAWVPAGMVTIYIGSDTWLGGDIDIEFGHGFHLPGSTVTVDDRTVVDQGVLVGVF